MHTKQDSFKCKVNLPEFKNKILRTDNIGWEYFYVWERNTKFNNYNGWSGYISANDIVLVKGVRK